MHIIIQFSIYIAVHCIRYRINVQWTLNNGQCTLYIVHNVQCTQCTVYIMYSVHNVQCTQCTLYIVHCTLYNVQCTQCTVFTMYTVHCTLYIVHCTMYSVHNVQCTLYTVHCTVYSVPYSPNYADYKYSICIKLIVTYFHLYFKIPFVYICSHLHILVNINININIYVY